MLQSSGEIYWCDDMCEVGCGVRSDDTRCSREYYEERHDGHQTENLW